MGKKRIPPGLIPAEIDDTAYAAVLTDVAHLLESARRAAARSVNSVMTATYRAVGRRIVEEEQSGKKRADYGEQLVTRLAKDLTSRYGRGFEYRNLYQMRQFHMTYPQIREALSPKSGPSGKELITRLSFSHFATPEPAGFKKTTGLLALSEEPA
jgi:hypothetical protein